MFHNNLNFYRPQNSKTMFTIKRVVGRVKSRKPGWALMIFMRLQRLHGATPDVGGKSGRNPLGELKMSCLMEERGRRPEGPRRGEVAAEGDQKNHQCGWGRLWGKRCRRGPMDTRVWEPNDWMEFKNAQECRKYTFSELNPGW